MADNRIDFMYNGEKYFAIQTPTIELSKGNGNKRDDKVIPLDLALLPKGVTTEEIEVVWPDRLYPLQLFPIVPPEKFVYVIGKYPDK